MADEPPFRVLSSRTAWSCPWFEIRQDELLLPGGGRATYNTLVKGDGVWVIPLTADGRVVLLRAWRYTVSDWCWEIPAGTRKAGATPEETARAELLEEAGGIAGSWERIGGFYTAFGVMSEVGHVFLARDVVLGPAAPEPTEVLEVHVVAAETALRWARDGTMTDSNSALALLRCEDRLRGRGGPEPGPPGTESAGRPL